MAKLGVLLSLGQELVRSTVLQRPAALQPHALALHAVASWVIVVAFREDHVLAACVLGQGAKLVGLRAANATQRADDICPLALLTLWLGSFLCLHNGFGGSRFAGRSRGGNTAWHTGFAGRSRGGNTAWHTGLT